MIYSWLMTRRSAVTLSSTTIENAVVDPVLVPLMTAREWLTIHRAKESARNNLALVERNNKVRAA